MSKNTVSQEKADTLRKLISKIRSFPMNFTDEKVFDSLFEVKPKEPIAPKKPIVTTSKKPVAVVPKKQLSALEKMSKNLNEFFALMHKASFTDTGDFGRNGQLVGADLCTNSGSFHTILTQIEKLDIMKEDGAKDFLLRRVQDMKIGAMGSQTDLWEATSMFVGTFDWVKELDKKYKVLSATNRTQLNKDIKQLDMCYGKSK